MVATSHFKSGKETQFQAKAYLYVSHLEALFSLYFFTQAAFTTLNICFRGPKQTYKLTHIFRKTTSRNKACARSRPMAGCGRVPGLWFKNWQFAMNI